MKERQKLTAVTAKKYRSARKKKSRILDTFTGQTKYDRKYAIHILRSEGKIKPAGKRVRAKITHKKTMCRIYPVTYDREVKEALLLVWEAFNYQCGKLLSPFLRANIDCIIKESKFNFSEEVTAKLRKISAATIDRLLKSDKAGLKNQIPRSKLLGI